MEMNYKDSIKIFYSNEIRSGRDSLFLDDSDFSFSCHFYDEPGHYRWPNFVSFGPDRLKLLTRDRNPDKILSEKEGFCGFCYSNEHARERINFFKKLSNYKQVDSGGPLLNNLGGWTVPRGWDHLEEWISKYKFYIAFENRSYPGYVTEKIYHAFIGEAIPIYWGNPRIAEDFNPKSFINVHNFGSFEKVIDRIREIDQNDDIYKEMIAQPPFRENIVPYPWTEEGVRKALQEVLAIFEA